ncbi:MAG: hypothetical protein WC523_04705 [Patescibacteria group bacterium]
MGYERNLVREEAKRVYKEQAKKVPKKQRMPFSQFFKRYAEAKRAQLSKDKEPDTVQDFDFGDLTNNVSEPEVVGQVNMPNGISDAEIEEKLDND